MSNRLTRNIVLLLGLLLCPATSVFANDTIAFVGATIFTQPDAEPIENAAVIINGDKILKVGSADKMSIPADTSVIDLSGLYLTSGFWNSHVHYTGKLEEAARQDNETLSKILIDTFLSWGFVNTVDTGSWLQQTLKIRERIASGKVAGPGILIAGGSFVPIGGSPFYIKPIELPELKNPEQTRDLVNQALNQGADAIKLFTGSWATPEGVVLMQADHTLAATHAAHQKNALVFAHPSDSDGARVAIENGVDILAHTFPSQIKGPWDRSLVDLMVSKNISLVPTLKLWRVELNGAGLPKAIVDRVESTAVEQTKLMHENGVPILFGTDVGYIDDADTTDEFRLMTQAGMSYSDILRSLTTAPAARYGLLETNGKVEKGFAADFVVLASDPRQSNLAFSDIVKTIRGGKIVFEK